jgi:hypothetical protein
MKERLTFPRCERRELRLTPLVQSFNSRWTAAPPFPQALGQTDRPRQPDSAPLVKDDIVGWPYELLVESANLPDRTLDSAANTRYPELKAPRDSVNGYSSYDSPVDTEVRSSKRVGAALAWVSFRV